MAGVSYPFQIKAKMTGCHGIEQGKQTWAGGEMNNKQTFKPVLGDLF
jgi:hypothetical protein